MKKKIDVAEDALVVYPFPPEDLDLLPRLRVVRVHNARVLRLQRCTRTQHISNSISATHDTRHTKQESESRARIRTRDDGVLEMRLEPPPPLAQRARIVRADVRHRVDDEPALGAFCEHLDHEGERREEAPGEDWMMGLGQ